MLLTNSPGWDFMSEIGLACSGSNEASRQNKIKVMPNFNYFILLFQIWLIDSLTHWLIDSWLMTHWLIWPIKHPFSGLLPVLGAISPVASTLWKACSEGNAAPHYDLRLSCVTQKEEILKFLGTIRFQFLIYIQNGGSFLIVDVGLFVVGAWQVAYSLLTYLRPVRMIPFSLITDILWLKWAILC